MSKTEEKIAEGVAKIVMHSREEMMSYFKGTCVDRVVRNSSTQRLIQFQGFALSGRSNRNYYYERREQEIANPKRLYVFDTGFLEVRHEPDTVTFYPGVANRSPEFQAIHRQLKDFFGKYLQGVILQEDDKNEYNSANNGREDKALVIGIAGVTNEEAQPDYREPWIRPELVIGNTRIATDYAYREMVRTQNVDTIWYTED